MTTTLSFKEHMIATAKVLAIIIAIVIFCMMTSCSSKSGRKTLPQDMKYKVGDVVYAKPDSLRYVIHSINWKSCTYNMYYIVWNSGRERWLFKVDQTFLY